MTHEPPRRQRVRRAERAAAAAETPEADADTADTPEGETAPARRGKRARTPPSGRSTNTRLNAQVRKNPHLHTWSDDPVERIWERRQLVAEWRIGQQMTYQAIADRLADMGEPISPQTVRLDMQVAARDAATSITREELVGEQRILSQMLIRANIDKMNRGNKDAGKLILDTMGHIAKLFGAYAPAQLDLGVSDAEYTTELIRVLQLIRPETLKDMINGHTAGRAAIAAAATTIDGEVVPDGGQSERVTAGGDIDLPGPDRGAEDGPEPAVAPEPDGGAGRYPADTADGGGMDGPARIHALDGAPRTDGAVRHPVDQPAAGHTEHRPEPEPERSVQLFDDGDGWSNIG